MDTKQPFYGTPLIKLLPQNQYEQEAPSRSRQSRLNQLQTVKDAQGRQRFHGAFTGGFSAGYFNSVSSKQGFKPKPFVSRRSDRRKDEPVFSHKPEDYMDEEDFDEFGIAPEKVRVRESFKHQSHSSLEDRDYGLGRIKTRDTMSIGEKILMRMGPESDQDQPGANALTYQLAEYEKNNFHGLGYVPLQPQQQSIPSSSNPLKLMSSSGKRIRISGEAFGTGVIEDYDDDYYSGNMDETYGIDDIKNYDFDTSVNHKNKPKLYTGNTSSSSHKSNSDNFAQFSPYNDLKGMNIGDDIDQKYPPPEVPDDWPTPKRAKSPFTSTSDVEELTNITLSMQSRFSKLSGRFTTSSKPLEMTGVDSKSGLVKYSDLKASSSAHTPIEMNCDTKPAEPSVLRERTIWKPCSLLCKRFNVQVPNVEESVIKLDRTLGGCLVPSISLREESETVIYQQSPAATMELKRSIFNIYSQGLSPIPESNIVTNNCDNDDEEPQLVELVGDLPTPNRRSESSSDLSDDVVILDSNPKLEPEVVVISNSSSDSDSPPPDIRSRERKKAEHRTFGSSRDSDSDDDYGPPLPPTRETLMKLNYERVKSESRREVWKKRRQAR